jgi:hypothetical protein
MALALSGSHSIQEMGVIGGAVVPGAYGTLMLTCPGLQKCKKLVTEPGVGHPSSAHGEEGSQDRHLPGSA